MVTNKKWLQMFEEKEGDHWKAKDKCRAVWSEDGEAYDCEILRIRTDCFGQRVLHP
ncbi:hypothetical protein SARC_11569 [Sphaeroforma arctica JP610]|uniref:Tudor domain-containing protein n=1 Tax=Sphaeroforma arctica JP610 TaxID=667725 RepID=A0A0L0FHG7_9EUKA|nr:hypothetical protein SARC_11569 [Sphaeroforma arctica JP610]KNC75916.1 hypothetical protein SARC_11569 [Sphaeroforma arctica JP610]|eukprot:XP_014149818.1 hypothetical protein SARC_11569 [Sphaeroforma arctica JP610]